MIPNLCIENGCFTKHLFINGCLVFQENVNVTVRTNGPWLPTHGHTTTPGSRSSLVGTGDPSQNPREPYRFKSLQKGGSLRWFLGVQKKYQFPSQNGPHISNHIHHSNGVFWKIPYTWNPKQPFINGCFSWMIPNLYIENGCFTKHPFINAWKWGSRYKWSNKMDVPKLFVASQHFRCRPPRPPWNSHPQPPRAARANPTPPTCFTFGWLNLHFPARVLCKVEP